LSQSEVGISETDKLNEMVQLLASLYEAAQRLPDGSERQEALRQIGGFQRRTATFIRRLGSEAQAIL
jgi:Mg2+ and Co2+ transporter CorA